MQKNSHSSQTNQNFNDINDKRLSINCFQPKQSKFLNTIYQNTEEDYNSEKFNTYRESAMSKSQYFSEFSIESESKPFQITQTDKQNEEEPHISKNKKIPSKKKFIFDFKFYIHCNICLTIITGENDLQYETKNFLKVSKIFNSNSTYLSNTNLEKENFNKKYDILYCVVCGNNIGIDLNKFKEYIFNYPVKIEKSNQQGVPSFYNSLPKYFLLKSRIVIRNMKSLKVGICGLKGDKMTEIEKSLNELIKEFKQEYDDESESEENKNTKGNFVDNSGGDYDDNVELKLKNREKETLYCNSLPSIEFVLLKQTKESLQNFSLIKNSKLVSDLDIIFIVHKMEGRVFLLGRNGYYNKLYDNLYQLVKGNFFFLLTYKKLDGNDSLDDNSDLLDNLINKGDQQLLQMFKDENKIIFLNDEKSSDEIMNNKFYFLNIFYSKFQTEQSDERDTQHSNYNYKKNSPNNHPTNLNFINSQVRQFTNEEYVLIDQFIFKLKNKILNTNSGKSKDFLKCFVL